jgi:hypothetical protein
VESTGEVITLVHKYEYQPEKVQERIEEKADTIVYNTLDELRVPLKS